MRFEEARVDREKILDDLLGSSSMAAAGKAHFFSGMGFTTDGWQRFAEALRRQASSATVESKTSDWGTKFVATGPIDAPSGRRYKVVSVSIDDGTGLRLVTAYPAKE